MPFRDLVWRQDSLNKTTPEKRAQLVENFKRSLSE